MKVRASFALKVAYLPSIDKMRVIFLFVTYSHIPIYVKLAF